MSIPLVFERSRPGRIGYSYPVSDVPRYPAAPELLRRREEPQLPCLSELDVVRHFSLLAKRTFGVDHGLYPLGSCTMKYNPKMHNVVARLAGFTDIHPLQQHESVQGSLAVMHELITSLSHITGMAWGSLQPAAGAHGEYTGLKIVRAYHAKRDDVRRTRVLVPVSAHGTNPASATLNGFSVTEVPTDNRGLVDMDALERCLDDTVAAIMLTNPNTLGFFEQDIVRIASMVHRHGALLYYDGANLNAIMGKVRPGDMGFDIVHLNLHKTFSTPHGGGGPGAGPVLVTETLRPFLPKPDIVREHGTYMLKWDLPDSIGRVSGFWGNYLVLVRAYAYVLTMGSQGLRAASEHAVLNANYCLSRLKETFAHPYGSLCMHEFVLSLLTYKERYGVTALDFSKALLDHGFHPPTMYFPLIVGEALMIEPTETESLEDLDDLIDTLIDLAKLAETNPQQLKEAPVSTEVRRLDEVRAAKYPKLRWKPDRES